MKYEASGAAPAPVVPARQAWAWKYADNSTPPAAILSRSGWVGVGPVDHTTLTWISFCVVAPKM